jgi:hypothetical protein
MLLFGGSVHESPPPAQRMRPYEFCRYEILASPTRPPLIVVDATDLIARTWLACEPLVDLGRR